MQEDFNPLVSIVIPVYNGSNYMREAIDSALAQTYPHIEVIVVNDGSIDNTDEIAKSYGNKIRYFTKENGGVSTALNLAIKNMQGEYFSWLSHDDVYLPEKIESQINILRNLDDKTTVIYGGYEYINEKGEILAEMRLEREFSLNDLNKPLFALFLHKISGCTLLINRIYFKKIGVFDPKLRITQDYDLWFRILQNADIRYDTHCLTFSRVHSAQTGKNLNYSEHNEEILFWRHIIESVSVTKLLESFNDCEELCENLYIRFKDVPELVSASIQKYIECICFSYKISKQQAIENIFIRYSEFKEKYLNLNNLSIKQKAVRLISDIIKKVVKKTAAGIGVE